MPLRPIRLHVSLREALHRNRAETQAMNHDWDVADVMGVINESDLEDSGTDANGERLAALATGSALRRAALRSIYALGRMTGLSGRNAILVRDVMRDLDVPEAGEALPPQPGSHRSEVRERGQHPQGVYPPPTEGVTGRPNDEGT